MIVPSVGRIVWLYRYSAASGHKGPLAAIVSKVHNDRLVNIMAILEEGDTFGQQKVTLVQEGDEIPKSDYCSWMPYQKAVAAGQVTPTLHAEASPFVAPIAPYSGKQEPPALAAKDHPAIHPEPLHAKHPEPAHAKKE